MVSVGAKTIIYKVGNSKVDRAKVGIKIAKSKSQDKKKYKQKFGKVWSG